MGSDGSSVTRIRHHLPCSRGQAWRTTRRAFSCQPCAGLLRMCTAGLGRPFVGAVSIGCHSGIAFTSDLLVCFCANLRISTSPICLCGVLRIREIRYNTVLGRPCGRLFARREIQNPPAILKSCKHGLRDRTGTLGSFFWCEHAELLFTG